MNSLKKLTAWSERLTTLRTFFLALTIFILFVALVLPQVAVISEEMTGTTASPDQSFFYRADDLYAMAETYGEEGRAFYIRARFTFDVVWPLVYGFFMITALVMLFRNKKRSSLWRQSPLTVYFGVGFDFLENTAASLVMYRYPALTPGVAEATPVFTQLKWVFIALGFLLILVGILMRLWSWLWSPGKKGRKLMAVILLFLVLLPGLGFLWYVNDYYIAERDALAALASDPGMTVYREGPYIIFEPLDMVADQGFIFYPGGKVDPMAYAPLIREIAGAAGIRAVIVDMPFNLAVLAPNRARGVIGLFPETNTWGIGGHSLGGAMAARYAARHPDTIEALVLWASYPDRDLSDTALRVLSVSATRDGLINQEKLESSREWLPPETTYIEIQGGNHARFGSYGPQEGDLEATITAAEQQRIVIEKTVQFLAVLREP